MKFSQNCLFCEKENRHPFCIIDYIGIILPYLIERCNIFLFGGTTSFFQFLRLFSKVRGFFIKNMCEMDANRFLWSLLWSKSPER